MSSEKNIPHEIEAVFNDTFKQPDTITKFQSIQKQETEEVLDNLGYISINQNSEDVELSDEVIASGIRTFREEYQVFQSVYTGLPELDQSTDELTEEELEYLHKISSLDGDFALEQYSLEEIRGSAVLSRILNRRLCILVIFQETVTSEVSEQVSEQLERLRSWCGVDSVSEVIRLTGDIDLLAERLARQDHYGDSNYHHIVYFKDEKRSLSSSRFRSESDLEWFKFRFDGFIPDESKELFELSSTKAEEIQLVLEDDLNKLMARLVHIQLWMFGTYQGLLDNDMGPLTLEGLSSLLEYIQDQYDSAEGYSMKNLVVPLKKDYWALNATFLFKAFLKVMEEMEESRESGKNETKTLAEEIGLFINQPDFSETDKNKILQEVNSQIESDYSSARNRKAKTRGSKGFLRTIGAFFSRIGKLISKGIGYIIRRIKKLFEWFKNGAKVLLRELKKIYSMIQSGLSFFFSKRKVKTESKSCRIVTDFDSNFDCVTYLTDEDHDAIVLHIQKNRALSQALNGASEFLGNVISIALKVAAGPLGWIQLGIETIKYLARTHFEYDRLSYSSFANS
jgi:hypothetical protein